MKNTDKKDEFDTIKNHPPKEDLSRIDERRFSQRLDELVAESEDMRMKRMRQHRTRGFLAINFSIFAALIGAGGFGWYFLIKLDIPLSLVWVITPIFLSILVHFWAGRPIKSYKREHKTIFMPKLAKALGGLNYDHARGMNQKILERALVLPDHTILKSEDSFMGTYKGVKVLFSEVSLLTSSSSKVAPAFHGIFVLLETGSDVVDGHTIITANSKLVRSHAKSQWKTLSKVHISPSNPDWDIFEVYSSKPEAAELIVGDRLLKELAEAAAVFGNAPLTAVLFGKKYVFLMVPNDKDMFEASDLYVPIATHQHALNCRKEISQILEIIDVFDLYQPLKS